MKLREPALSDALCEDAGDIFVGNPIDRAYAYFFSFVFIETYWEFGNDRTLLWLALVKDHAIPVLKSVGKLLDVGCTHDCNL